MENENKIKPLRVLLVGGGSGGPVSPLLAIAEEIRQTDPQTEFLFIGGKTGPERRMVEHEALIFKTVPSGKFRRYFSFRTLISPWLVLLGFIKSLFIISHFKPSVVMGAGSYIQVPVLWAAWFLGVPVLIHQQDFERTLANALCAPIAKTITVSFKDSEKSFSHGLGLFPNHAQSKVKWTGNPIRQSVLYGDREVAYTQFSLTPNRPTLLVLGGGTGAEAINAIIDSILPSLHDVMQVIHAAGAGKFKFIENDQYHGYEFIERMDLAYAAADIVITRAGLSTITELSRLGKISIIIPMPETHQEANAEYLSQKNAAIVVDQREIIAEKLVQMIRTLLLDRQLQRELTENIKSIMPAGATEQVITELRTIAKV